MCARGRAKCAHQYSVYIVVAQNPDVQYINAHNRTSSELIRRRRFGRANLRGTPIVDAYISYYYHYYYILSRAYIITGTYIVLLLLLLFNGSTTAVGEDCAVPVLISRRQTTGAVYV